VVVNECETVLFSVEVMRPSRVFACSY